MTSFIIPKTNKTTPNPKTKYVISVLPALGSDEEVPPLLAELVDDVCASTLETNCERSVRDVPAPTIRATTFFMADQNTYLHSSLS